MKTKTLEQLELCTFADDCVKSNYGAFPICYRDYISCIHYQKLMEQKLKELEICPYANVCAVEYGGADVCKEERDYENCVIYKELKKQEKK